MKITKARAGELGLFTTKEDCLSCVDCIIRGDTPWCSTSFTPIKENNMLCLGLDEHRLRQEMTDEEYEAYRHNKLEVLDIGHN